MAADDDDLDDEEDNDDEDEENDRNESISTHITFSSFQKRSVRLDKPLDGSGNPSM